MSPEEHLNVLGRALHAVLNAHRVSAGATSKALGHHTAYLARALRGTFPLRVEAVFQLFQTLGAHPEDFFHELYPLGGEPLMRLEAGLGGPADDEASRVVRELWNRRRGEPLSPTEYRLRMGELLASSLQRVGVSQRSVSIKMGKSPGVLSQALRGQSHLTFLQVFTALEAARCDPGRLFFQLFMPRPADVYKRLRQTRSVELLELALRKASEGHFAREERAAQASVRAGPAHGSPRS